MDRVIKEITQVLVERLELQIDVSQLDPESELIDDLGLDSAAILELVVGLEEAFEIDLDIAGSTADDFRSIRGLARYVKSRL
jgi:acyl carrier protein